MPKLSGPYGVGAFFVMISAILHLLTFIPGGFSSQVLVLLPIGLLYLLITAGLTRGMRWLAYVTFILMCLGGIFAMSQLWTPSALPLWWLSLIIIADWVAAAALFVVLWHAQPETSVS